MSEGTEAESERLSRVLGAGDAASIMISNMIGTGILTLPGLVALAMGEPHWALLAWAAGGVVSLAGALVHAELGCRFPRAGGDYIFLREGLGVPVAFLSGWTSFVIGFPGAIALSSMAAANSLFDAAALSKSRWLLLALTLLLLAGISAIHSAGLRWGKRVQNFLVFLKVGILLVLIVAAYILVEPVAAQEITEKRPLATAAFLILFAYSGWNSAAYVAGEIREPRKNLPRALIGGVLVVIALYIAVNLAYFRVVPAQEMGKNINIMGEVAGRIFGQGGGQIFSLALALVFIGSASAMIITGPRIYYAMACDGVFPRSLTAVGKTSRVPVRSIWLQSLWAAGLLAIGTSLTPEVSKEHPITETFDMIAGWTIFAILPFAALTTCSVFILRRRDRSLGSSPSYSTPGYPLTPLLFVLLILAVEVAFAVVGMSENLSGEYWASRNRTSAIIGSSLVFSGIPVYFFWKIWGRRSAGS